MEKETKKEKEKRAIFSRFNDVFNMIGDLRSRLARLEMLISPLESELMEKCKKEWGFE